MNWRALAFGAFAALSTFVVFFLAGVPIFQRGVWAAACYLVTGVAFNVGVNRFAQLQRAQAQREADAPVPTPTRPSPYFVTQAEFKALSDRTAAVEQGQRDVSHVTDVQGKHIAALEDRMKKAEDRISSVSVVAGISPRAPRT